MVDGLTDGLSDGFDKSDLGVKEGPKPPNHKLRLNEKAHYVTRRLQSLNMVVSDTYEDLEDGKLIANLIN